MCVKEKEKKFLEGLTHDFSDQNVENPVEDASSGENRRMHLPDRWSLRHLSGTVCLATEKSGLCLFRSSVDYISRIHVMEDKLLNANLI